MNKVKDNLVKNSPIILVEDFFNKTAQEIDKTYFPHLKYYRDDQNDADVHYALECFNNGGHSYDLLIQKLAKSCNDSKENIHAIVSKYIKDFGDYAYNTSTEEINICKWPYSMYSKKKSIK